MTVGGGLGSFNKGWQMRHANIIRDQLKPNLGGRLKRIKGMPGRLDIGLQPGDDRDAYEPNFRNGAGVQTAGRGCHGKEPMGGPGMKHVSRMGQCNQGIHVQQLSHGKSANAVRTSSLETFTSGGDSVIFNPVAGSRMSLVRSRPRDSSVKMMESPSTRQLNLLPGRNCNRVRTGLGSTTCPLLDSVTNCFKALSIRF